MEFEKELDYWINQAQEDLHCFSDNGAQSRSIIISLKEAGVLDWYVLPEKKGLIAYTLVPDFRGQLSVQEVFMYIKPEYRGKIKLFKELVEQMEKTAKEKNCVAVRIASNIGYNDEKVLRVLKLFGYKTDSVVKYME